MTDLRQQAGEGIGSLGSSCECNTCVDAALARKPTQPASSLDVDGEVPTNVEDRTNLGTSNGVAGYAMTDLRQQAEKEHAARLRELAQHWTDAKSYTRRYRPETAEGLDPGWRELLMEAETSHRLLDVVAHDGLGELDERVAAVVLRLSHAEGFLASIANAHDRERAGGGMVGDFCIECERRWPCPTYQWANGDRDMNDSWEGSDDD